MANRGILICCCTVVLTLGGARASLAQVAPDGSPLRGEVAQLAPAAQTASPIPSRAGDVSTSRIPDFKDLFKPLGRDFRNLISEKNLFILGLGTVGSLGVHRWDRGVADASFARGTLGDAMRPGDMIGNMAVQGGAAFATYMVGRALDNPRVANVGAELVRAQIVAQLTTQVVKFSVQRTRPDGTTLSFPSGHTSSAFATATVLQSNFGWKAGVPAYALASLIATSRMKDDRHYLSDVIAGATIGILAGRSVTIGSGSARFNVAPMAVPGGLGVSFVQIQKP